MLIVEYPYIVATLCDVNPAIYFFKQENSATRQFFINLIIYYKKNFHTREVLVQI